MCSSCKKSCKKLLLNYCDLKENVFLLPLDVSRKPWWSPPQNKLGLHLDQHPDVKVLLGAKNVASAGVSPPTAGSLFSLTPCLPFSRTLVRISTHNQPDHNLCHWPFLFFLPEGRRLTEKIFSPCVTAAVFGCQIYRTSCPNPNPFESFKS